MHDFFERITAYVHWALFLLLEVLSGFLLFQYNHYQGSVWFTQANTVAAIVHEWEAKALSYLRMPAENAALVRRNIILQQKLDILRHELAQAGVDTAAISQFHDFTIDESTNRQIVKFSDCQMTLIPAQIVDNSVRKRDNMLVINVGSDDGVAPEMGVEMAKTFLETEFLEGLEDWRKINLKKAQQKVAEIEEGNYSR